MTRRPDDVLALTMRCTMEFIDLLGARADERLSMRGEIKGCTTNDKIFKGCRMNYVDRSPSEESEMEDL
jgi:hypothetical protein